MLLFELEMDDALGPPSRPPRGKPLQHHYGESQYLDDMRHKILVLRNNHTAGKFSTAITEDVISWAWYLARRPESLPRPVLPFSN
jgi:hypothetical protein